MQMPARTPAMTAMTAATLDLLRGGRFLLGLGALGPAGGRGLARPALRQAARAARASTSRSCARSRRARSRSSTTGEHYDIPYAGPDATGLGKPLKIIVHPLRADIPIYLAAIGPKNVELTAEIADGWLPIFFSPHRLRETYGAALDAGFAKAGGGKSLADFDVAPTVTVIARRRRRRAAATSSSRWLALYIGGMGARGKNFYNDLACRYGFEAEAKEIQDLYLDGKKARGDAPPCPTSSSTRSRCSGRRSASPTGSRRGSERGSRR